MGIGGHRAEAQAGNSYYREPSGRGSSPGNRINPQGFISRPELPEVGDSMLILKKLRRRASPPFGKTAGCPKPNVMKSTCERCPFRVDARTCRLPTGPPSDSVKTAKEHYRKYFGQPCKR